MSFCLLGYPKENRFSCCKNHTRKIFLLQNSKVEWAASLTGEKSLDFSPLPFPGQQREMGRFPDRGKIPRFFPSHFFRGGSVELAASMANATKRAACSLLE